jgi:hypothetical protein
MTAMIRKNFMNSQPLLVLCTALSLLLASHLKAAQIVCQGVLANSGEQAQTLVHFSATPASGLGIVYDAPSGSLWSRGGDGILNRYALDGRLLATYPIPKVMFSMPTDRMIRVGSQIILSLKGKLYALPIDAGSGTAPTALNIAADLISAGSVNGALAIATASTDRKIWQVSLYNPGTGQTSPIVSLPVPNVRQIELLPDGDLVVHIPGSTLGDAHVSSLHDLHLYHNGQEVTDGWPRPSPGEHMTFLDNYWYGATGHATVRRFNVNLEPDPGVVLGGGSGAFIGRVDNNEEIGVPCGLVKIREGLYAVAGSTGVVHLLEWNKDKLQFTIIRRIGALQSCLGLGLNRNGDIWYNSGLWHWNDPPDAPQGEGITGVQMGQFALLPDDHFSVPAIHGVLPAVVGGNFTWHIIWDQLQQQEPKSGFLHGSVIYKDAKGIPLLLAIDSTGNARSYRIDPGQGNATENRGPVALETASPVKEWTSLAMKNPDTLLGAGDGYVIEMARDGVNWKETRRWNAVPDGTLGSEIHLTSDAGRLWVSDTDNHRVLCFNLNDGTLAASFGEKGKAGDDLSHLDSPRVIAARDQRVIVYDSGNQRLVKLFFSE